MLAMLSLVATTFADIPHRHSLIRRIVKSHNALIGNVHLEFIMAKINFSPGQYNNNKSTFHFYNGSFVNTYNAFAEALSSSTQFNTELWNAFAEAVHWGTPSVYDKSLTIGHFVNRYIDKSIDFIRKITKSDKVSLFGYCWGGDLALMYAALHPEKVKNLITIATPGDFDL